MGPSSKAVGPGSKAGCCGAPSDTANSMLRIEHVAVSHSTAKHKQTRLDKAIQVKIQGLTDRKGRLLPFPEGRLCFRLPCRLRVERQAKPGKCSQLVADQAIKTLGLSLHPRGSLSSTLHAGGGSAGALDARDPLSRRSSAWSSRVALMGSSLVCECPTGTAQVPKSPSSLFLAMSSLVPSPR